MRTLESAPDPAPAARAGWGLSIALAASSIAPSVMEWIGAVLLGREPTFNDFHSYWLAGRLLLEGRSPYDLEAMRALGQSEGLQFDLGTGYSYPLPFAFLMTPFAALPFGMAALLFSLLSALAFSGLVAWWLVRFHPGSSRGRLLGAAALAGAFPPVGGTLAFGQANLVVLLPLAIGLALIVRGTASARPGGVFLGLAAIVKIVPFAILLPLALARRWPPFVSLLATAVVAMAAASILAPWAAADTFRLSELLGPDPFFTNQSLNGFVSRLVLESGRTLPLAPGAFDPAVVSILATLAFGLVNLGVLVPPLRDSPTRATLALAIGLVLVAATIAAPKNSFWNQALVLPGLGLLLAVDVPDLSMRRFGRLDRLLLVGCWAGLTVQFILWHAPLPRAGALASLATLAQSSALFGMLALWVLLVRRVRASASGT
jgi:hypothetical protein